MSAVRFFLMPVRCAVIGGLAWLSFVGFAPLHAQAMRFEFAQRHMGMEVRVILYAAESASARTAAGAAFDRIRKLEDTMSDYRDESEVRRLGRRQGNWVSVSEALYQVLSEALALAERSGGAFDPTVGPIVGLWREARRTGQWPPPPALESARSRVGWRLIEVDSARRAVRLLASGMSLDLGGIAKGYILDQALLELKTRGISRALLVAGGDIVVGDPPPGLAGWRVSAPGASPDLEGRAATLANAAFSTSGASEQFVVIGGVRYSHVVDPRTGVPLTDGRLVYVIARSGLIADGVATALTVADSVEAQRLLAFYPGVIAEVQRE